MHNLKRMLLVSACIISLAVPTPLAAAELNDSTATVSEVTDTTDVSESDVISNEDPAEPATPAEPTAPAEPETPDTGKDDANTDAPEDDTDITDNTTTTADSDNEDDPSAEEPEPEPEVKNGLVEEDGKTYFYRNGKKIKNKVVKAEEGVYYYLQKDGTLYTKTDTLVTDPATGKKYTFKEDGTAYTSVVKEVNGKYYFFSRYGSTAGKKGEVRKLYGYYYSFNADGTIMTNQKNVKVGDYYYYFGSTGKAYTDKWISRGGNKRTYFGKQGRALTNKWKYDGKKLYYLGKDGITESGFHKNGNTWYYIDKTTYVTKFKSNALYKSYNNIKGYSSSSSYLITVDTVANRTIIYKGYANHWTPYKVWKCSPGKSSTPTVKGTYYVGSKGYSFGGSDYTCYWYTQICRDYLFHSVLYQRGTFKIRDGRLGRNLSHGCVRLAIDNAKWIYDNIPRGTTIRIW